MLYSFLNLARKLTQLGYPESAETGFRVIKRDLTQEERAGNIEFKDDGIYLTSDGQEYKGYMYIKQPFIVNFGYRFPKFHITNCEVIQEQKMKGKFSNRYYWHNSNVVDLTDTQTGELFSQVSLELCSKCKFQTGAFEYSDTQGFFGLLDKQEQDEITQEYQVDIRGYTLDWEQISREFRKEKEYTCENCGIRMEVVSDRRFIHVHHKNGNKLINKRTNLECLCILCHAYKDELHERNFGKRSQQAEIKSFVSKYRDKLNSLNNGYINRRE